MPVQESATPAAVTGRVMYASGAESRRDCCSGGETETALGDSGGVEMMGPARRWQTKHTRSARRCTL